MIASEMSPSAVESNSLAIGRIAQIEADLKAWAGKRVEFSFDPSGTDLFSIVELSHSYARRSVDLADSIRLLLGEGRVIPATILGRALIETVGMGCLFLHDMNRLIAAGDRPRIDVRVKRFYTGVKGGTVEPVHVMDAMRHLEKVDGEYVEYLDSKYGLFALAVEASKRQGAKNSKDPREVWSALKNYDFLSEVSHPNGAGTQLLYPDSGEPSPQADELRQRFRHASLMAIWQCHHLLNALEGLTTLPDNYKRAFLPPDKDGKL